MTLDDLKVMIVFRCMGSMPEWVRYAAVDRNGKIFVYSIKPVLSPEPDMKDIWSMPDTGDVNYDKYYEIHKIKQDVSKLWKNSLVELT